MEEVVDYANEREYDVQRVSQTDSEHSNRSYSSGLSQDLDLDIEHQYNFGNENFKEEEKEPVVDKLEKRKKDLFSRNVKKIKQNFQVHIV